MRDRHATESRAQPSGEGVRELQARLYREIGLLAVARALDLGEDVPGHYEMVSELEAMADTLAPREAAETETSFHDKAKGRTRVA